MVESVYISTMGLNIKNKKVEQLVDELARLKKTSKTEAIRIAAQAEIEREKAVQGGPDRWAKGIAYLEKNVWPNLNPKYRGKGIPQEEQDDILGYGPEGY